MHVALTDEQRLVVDTAAQFAGDHAYVGAPAGAALVDDPAAWAALVGTGLVGLHLPEAAGGGGGTALDAALVSEQLAAALCRLPFIGQGVLAAELATAAGATGLAQEITSGGRVAIALDHAMARLAREREPAVVWDALGATDVLLLDASGRLARAPVRGDALDAVDRTRTLRRLPADVELQPVSARPLSDADQDRFYALAYTMAAADLIGVMQSALDAAVAYVADRVQFGVPVGSFQAVQHLGADAAVLVEGARSSVWHAAWSVDEEPAAAARLAARQAKAYASRAGREVTEISVQLHGGIAITWEHLAHVRLRRALFMGASFGDTGAQLRAIADARLGSRVEHG